MSFWSRLGDTAEAVGKGLLNNPGSVVGAWNMAQATISGDEGSVKDNFTAALNDNAQTVAESGGTLAANTINTAPGQKILAPLVWTATQASHGIAAGIAYDEVAGDGLHNPFAASNWKKAWQQTQDVTGGEAYAYGVRNTFQGNPDKPLMSSGHLTRDFSEYADTHRVTTGATDIALTWFADPTLVLGKAAKAARVGNEVLDAIEAEKVYQASKVGEKPGLAGSVFGRGADTKAQRAGRTVASIDNVQSPAEVAAKLGPTISRSSDAAPLTDLLAQAGKIDDVDLQRAVKTNVILAGMGSPSARAELIDQAPAVARAMQRTESAPEEFALLDNIHAAAGNDGESLTQAARDLATPENEAELVAYGKTLDHIQTRFEQLDELAQTGGSQYVGRTALDRAKGWVRSKNATFTFQDSASGRTVNALYWATAQRSRGVIATDDALRGQAELADTLKRSKLYSGDETQRVVDQYLSNTTQAGRARVVEHLHDDMIERVAHEKGMSVEDMNEFRTGLQSAFNAGRQYSTQALEKARANGEGRVVLNDPTTNAPFSVKAEVLETHIRNNAIVPDVEKMRELADKHLAGRSPFQATKDAATALNGVVNGVNDYWRIGMLARPGLFFRTQLDTQPRVAMMLGATTYLRQAMESTGHWGKKTLTHDELKQVSAQAEDLARKDGLLDEAASQSAAQVERLQQIDSRLESLAGHDEVFSAPAAPAFDGGAPLFHGTSNAFEGDKPLSDPWGQSGATNLFGYGFYATESENVAKTYTLKGRGGNPAVYDVKWKGDRPPRVLDLDEAHSPEIKAWASDLLANAKSGESSALLDVPDESIAATTKLIEDNATSGEIVRSVRQLMGAAGMRSSDADEVMASLAHNLSEKYDVLKHVGGVYNKRGTEQHNVSIFLDPSKLDTTRSAVRETSRQSQSRQAEVAALRAEREGLAGRDAGAGARAVASRDPQLEGAQRLGAQDKTVRVAGQKATTRAYRNVQEQNDLASVLRPGDSPSDVLLGLHSKMTSKFYENADDWKTYAPDNVKWDRAYVRATDALRNSYTGKKVLREADLEDGDLVASLKKDPRVRAEWREVSRANEHFDDWVARAIHYADWHAPTPELRARLAERRIEPEEVGQFFKPHRAEDTFADTDNVVTRDADGNLVDTDARAERFDVHGPAFSFSPPRGNVNDRTKELLGKFIGKLSDQPDHILGRHPLYVGRYFHHFKELAAREIDRTGELSVDAQARIERIAKHRAVKDTQQTMFDTARSTGAHQTMRNLVPFQAAWEDAMMSWSRLMYDDPSRIGKLAKVWTAPERMQLVVDQDGQPVKFGQKADQKFVVVPVPGIAQHFIGSKEFKFRKDSLNSIMQGEVPWLPGFGPKVQIPANEIIARAYPELPNTKAGDNPLVKSMFPSGVPRTAGVGSDLFNSLSPSWVKRLSEAWNPNSDGGVGVYSDSIYSQVIEARKAGRPDPTARQMNEKALKSVRNVGIIKAMSIGLFGVSGEGGNTADFYRNQYNAMREHEAEYTAQGLTLEQAFAKEYPEAASLDFRLSKNNTGINATVKVQDRSRTFAKQIGENPEYGWFYVGSDNIGGEFSQSVYNSQRSSQISDSNPAHQRSKYNAQESMDHLQASTGWNDFSQVSMTLNNTLKSRGLTNLQQSGAADLADFKRQFMDKLRVQNPAWAKEYDSYDPNKVQTFIDQVALPATKDKKLKDRTDVKATGEYLELRAAALDILKSAGVKSLSSKQAAEFNAFLYQKGQKLADQNLGFSQTWTRILSREVEPDETVADGS